jgi:hypothetical protein
MFRLTYSGVVHVPVEVVAVSDRLYQRQRKDDAKAAGKWVARLAKGEQEALETMSNALNSK